MLLVTDNMNEVIKMKYEGICDLVASDDEAKKYFHSLSNDVQQSLMAHGAGVNSLEELKNFADVVQKQG